MAHYYFGHVNPIGKHVWLDNEGTAYEIVGVVADAHYAEIREAPPRTLYINDFHRGPLVSNFALRTSVDPLAIASAVRRTVQEVLPSVSIEQFTTLDDQINASIVPERLVGTLSGVLGAQDAALAGLGVFGLLGYTVSRRTREIGIRMAMGSSRAEVIRIVLRDAMQMTAAGLAIGTGIAFWGTQMSRHFIAELPASNAVVLIFGAIATIAIAVMAAYLPARRAAKVDPVVALRYE